MKEQRMVGFEFLNRQLQESLSEEVEASSQGESSGILPVIDPMDAESVFRYYERARDLKVLIGQSFNVLEQQHNDVCLRTMFGCGISVILRPEWELTLLRNDSLLKRTYQCKVESVDRDARTIVLVLHDRDVMDPARRKKDIIGQMRRALRENPESLQGICVEPVHIVDKVGVFCDVLRIGIPGFIAITNWQHGYTESLAMSANRYLHQIIEVDVVGWNAERQQFLLSRRRQTTNLWEQIAEQFHPDDVVRVTCVSINEEHGFFYGAIENIDGISLLCNFPANQFSTIPVELGGIYEVKIKKVSVEEHIFKGSTFRMLGHNKEFQRQILAHEDRLREERAAANRQAEKR